MSWTLSFTTLTPQQLNILSHFSDSSQVEDYLNMLPSASFGDIAEVMISFAEYNDTIETVLQQPVITKETNSIKLDSVRIYDFNSIQKVLLEFTKMNFDDMETFDGYEDIKAVCVNIRNLFQFAYDHKQIIIVYRV